MKEKLLLVVLILIVIFSSGCSGDLKYKLNTKVQEGQGSINVKPDKEIYNENEKVKLTAIPDDGFKFKKWTGDVKRA